MTAVVWWSNHQPEIASGFKREYWDQHILWSLFDGSTWRPTEFPSFRSVDGFENLAVETPGAVVVVPARWHVDDVGLLNELIRPLEWCLLVLAGDEENVFPRFHVEHPNIRTWVQTPMPGDLHGARPFGDGVPPLFKESIACAPNLSHRLLKWSFAGQLNNPRRLEMHGVLARMQEERHDGRLKVTRVFGSGLPYKDYVFTMAETAVAPCPSGTFTPDTFRLYEAMEAGCVPVVDVGPVDGPRGYWETLFGESPPFPVLEDWEQFPDVLDELMRDWRSHANRVGAWWQGKKRELAYGLKEDLKALGA